MKLCKNSDFSFGMTYSYDVTDLVMTLSFWSLTTNSIIYRKISSETTWQDEEIEVPQLKYYPSLQRILCMYMSFEIKVVINEHEYVGCIHLCKHFCTVTRVNV